MCVCVCACVCVCMCANYLNFIDELPEDLISESDLRLEPGPGRSSKTYRGYRR